MLGGFNNNIVHQNNIYHVQTENGGLTNPVITTLVYLKGGIVASKKTDYSDFIDKENTEETIRQIMEDQHKEIIKLLLSGQYDANPEEKGEDV